MTVDITINHNNLDLNIRGRVDPIEILRRLDAFLTPDVKVNSIRITLDDDGVILYNPLGADNSKIKGGILDVIQWNQPKPR